MRNSSSDSDEDNESFTRSMFCPLCCWHHNAESSNEDDDSDSNEDDDLIGDKDDRENYAKLF